MDFLQHHFVTSGVETYLWFPPLVAFLIAVLTSTGGISGAFLLLPFQISVLGFTTPGVTATNFFYNVVGTPGGVYRYAREKRMLWHLAVSVIAGTLPGVLIGYYVRTRFFPDPKAFKLFVGIVLLYIGVRLVSGLLQKQPRQTVAHRKDFFIGPVTGNVKTIRFDFNQNAVFFRPLAVFFLGIVVGVIGGIYGIGGSAILAPILITFFGLPVYTIAGALLAVNFVTSLAGVLLYCSIPFFNGQTSPPDWHLGMLLGVGGLSGMYLGAKLQRYLPEKTIKLVLMTITLIVASKYILQYF